MGTDEVVVAVTRPLRGDGGVVEGHGTSEAWQQLQEKEQGSCIEKELPKSERFRKTVAPFFRQTYSNRIRLFKIFKQN